MENGFYWVRRSDEHPDDWEVAEFTGAFFFFCGFEEFLEPHELAEIGKRVVRE